MTALPAPLADLAASGAIQVQQNASGEWMWWWKSGQEPAPVTLPDGRVRMIVVEGEAE
jgi:hypothetical protein